jgi:nicotinamide mononucleotide (NMN) deamidase PncC
MIELAIGWLASHDYVPTVIAGARARAGAANAAAAWAHAGGDGGDRHHPAGRTIGSKF